MAAIASMNFRSWGSGDTGTQSKTLSRPVSSSRQATTNNLSNPAVFVVDDDSAMRDALVHLLSRLQYSVFAFASAAEFLDFGRPDRPGCLLVDLELPDRSGLALQQQLAGGRSYPILFVTDRGDVSSCVRAMKDGAVDILQKPLGEGELGASHRDRPRVRPGNPKQKVGAGETATALCSPDAS